MAQSKYNKKIITEFIEIKNFPNKIDWNFVMIVVEKIEDIIEHPIKIDKTTSITWWYNPKKTGTFGKGNGGGGGETVERTCFDVIFGQHHCLYVYYSKKNIATKEFMEKNEFTETKIEAVLLACSRWIEWYNDTVLKCR